MSGSPIGRNPARSPVSPSWTAALVSAAMLLAANCDGIGGAQRGSGTCIVIDGDESDENSGIETACAAGDSSADTEVINRTPPQSQPGGTVIANAKASSDPASASAIASHATCYVATQAANVSASLFVAQLELNEFCVNGGGYSSVEFDFRLTKNGSELDPVVEASAQVDCAAQTVETTGGFFNCTSGGVAGRFNCEASNTTFFDLEPVEPGDQLVGSMSMVARAVLDSIEPIGDGSQQVEVQATYFFFAAGLNEEKCPEPESCSSNGDCGGELVCIDLLCLVPDFGDPADATVSISPENPDPGQALDLSFTFALPAGTLMPNRLVLETPDEGIDVNGTLTAGMFLGSCNVGGRTIHLRVLESLEEVLADADGDGVADAGEPIGTFGVDQGTFRVDIAFADPPLVFTIPKDTLLSCLFPSVFLAGDEGRHPIEYVATAIDVDTGGVNNGAGLAPIVLTGVAAELVVGNPQPACGDADGSGASASVAARAGRGQIQLITASDALRVLRGAVGVAECPDCVCDVNSAGGVTAGDALLVLRAAVGLDVDLSCPDC
jgi:hypothetical protein